MTDLGNDLETSNSDVYPDQITRNIIESHRKYRSPNTGDLAELRRLDPLNPGGGAFWRLVVRHLEPGGQLRFPDSEQRWALILRLVGHLLELHKENARLGFALAEAKVSEMRLSRLLRADLDGLDSLLRTVTHQLESAYARVDLGDVASLVTTAPSGTSISPAAQRIRRRVARHYYRAIRTSES
ncbi:MAG: type I-E CRISPR-associated protein Cse2/CasB [Acidobacteriota bacterium]